MDISDLLTFTRQTEASDLHLSSGAPPVLRVHGGLRPIKASPLTPEQVRGMLHSVMTEEQRIIWNREHDLDFAITLGSTGRFRVNAFAIDRGPAAVFRAIPASVPNLKSLDAPAILAELADLKSGLVLVTGPTGSGKSTTLAAMVDHINRHQAKHILTIEDPVEFVHRPDHSLISHREVGAHTQSFGRALKSALREDPDVILVGEMRDHETISLALTAAETGHLVLGTLHTNGAAKAVDRIIDVFPGSDKDLVRAMLAGSLQAVVGQELLGKTGGGRVAAYDILIGTPAVRNLIRENKVPQITSMMQMGQRFGMKTLEDSVKDLVNQGVVEAVELERFRQTGTDKA
ncbi:MAG TPA: type IV pilus twitching motility protein PilT [Candidatus Sulfotelmatobacter sp.]|jgi:twitching motility protein PilT|nr:type IV pilus twitching motility protein PilT [Candidatus Sulfotelmatobacter sp.]